MTLSLVLNNDFLYMGAMITWTVWNYEARLHV